MGTTALTPLPYPESTDQPYVHLDIKALADATAESLFVAASAAPPHKAGRRWHRTTDGAAFISDGTIWHPVQRTPAITGALVGAAYPGGTAVIREAIITSTVTPNASGDFVPAGFDAAGIGAGGVISAFAVARNGLDLVYSPRDNAGALTFRVFNTASSVVATNHPYHARIMYWTP